MGMRNLPDTYEAMPEAWGHTHQENHECHVTTNMWCNTFASQVRTFKPIFKQVLQVSSIKNHCIPRMLLSWFGSKYVLIMYIPVSMIHWFVSLFSGIHQICVIVVFFDPIMQSVTICSYTLFVATFLWTLLIKRHNCI